MACGRMKNVLCAHFSRASFGLQHSPASDFLTSQWDIRWWYPVWLTGTAAYCIGFALYAGVCSPYGSKIFIWMTYWAYWTLMATLSIRAFLAWRFYLIQKQTTNDRDAEANGCHVGDEECNRGRKGPTPLCGALWVLYNVSSDASFLVTVLFWSLNYVGQGANELNLNSHGVNALFVLVDALLTRTPVRLAHFVHCFVFLMLYVLFVVLYWVAGGTDHNGNPYIYKILNLSKRPGRTSVILLVVPLIAAPIAHALLFGLFRFRLFLHRKFASTDGKPEKAVPPEAVELKSEKC